MKLFHKLSAMLLGIMCLSCVGNKSSMQLQAGDLLFQGATSNGLSKAIDKVTQTGAKTHFSHVGLVELDGEGELFVLHADPDDGTCRVRLEQFLKPEEDSILTVLYRLKEPWRKSIPSALIEAHKMLGQPYNFSYVLSDSALYCSEFIYEAFKGDHIFELNPMTFKDPATGEFYPTWVDYYKKLKIEIPEGQPGCNPNRMAASDKLECLGILVE